MLDSSSNEPKTQALSYEPFEVNSSFLQSSRFSVEDDAGKSCILRFDRHDDSFKQYMKQLNHAFTFFKDYDQIIFQSLLKLEKKEYVYMKKAIAGLDRNNQKPYINIMKNYSHIISQHEGLIGSLDQEEVYLAKIKQASWINQTIFEEYQETISWPYYLRGVLGLMGAFLFHLIIGATLRWNMLNLYATSFYKITAEPYLIVKEDSYAAPLALFCMGIGMRIGLRVVKVIGATFTYITAVLGAGFSVFISSYMPQLFLYVIFAVALYAITACLAFNSCINQCHSYFPKRRTLINGFVLVGSGLGHVLFGLINVQCINPDHLSPQNGFFGGNLDFVARRLPQCMRDMSIVVFSLGALAILLIQPLIQYNEGKEVEKNKIGFKIDFSAVAASEEEALTSRIFWTFVLIIILTTCGNYFMITNYKNLVSKESYNQQFTLDSIMIAFNIANALSRVLWTIIFSRCGFKNSYMILAAINIIIFSIIQFVLPFQQIYLIFYILGGISLGGAMVLFLNLTTEVFGEFIGEQLPGYVWTSYAIANFAQYLIVDMVDISNGFETVFHILLGVNVVVLIIVVKVNLQGEWENSTAMLEFRCRT